MRYFDSITLRKAPTGRIWIFISKIPLAEECKNHSVFQTKILKKRTKSIEKLFIPQIYKAKRNEWSKKNVA
jgi:hypothetical protein